METLTTTPRRQAARLLQRDFNGERPVQRWMYLLIGVVGGVAAALPLYWMVRSSVLDYAQYQALPTVWIPQSWHLENYLGLFQGTQFARWYANTLLLALASTVNVLLVNGLAAYAFARLRFPGRDVIFLLYLSTMMIPGETTVVPLFLVVRFLNFYDTYQGMILPGSVSAFTVFMLRQFFLGMSREVEEAAKMDGCGVLRVFWHMILPQSRPIIAVIAIGSVAGAFSNYFWPLVVTQSEEIRPVAVMIPQLAGYLGSGNPMVLQAALVVTIVPVVLFVLVNQRNFIQGFGRSLVIG